MAETKKWGLVIDVTRCDGCGSCLLSVKDEYTGNDYPGYAAVQPKEGVNWLWLKEVEQGHGTKIKMDYIPVMFPHNRNFKLSDIPGAPEGAIGQVILEKNPLIYSWNLPVLVALLFATGDRFFSLNKLLLVYLLLLPFHAWGVGFDLLKTLTLDTGSEIAGQLGYSGWSLEFIGLAYQFGYLMLPVIGATSIWVGMNRELIESMLISAPGKATGNGVN